ncbi:potassium/proton antiporter [uncultured Chloroflexus sp.]|uniref:potassium/proton antiporter n=1 Tax=uncultured Chloroflexus sp. TaxID=214040 RepID=UPI00260FAB6C|nr:potassium/proton antiporter [uncultured Chloroflexus sp.]
MATEPLLLIAGLLLAISVAATRASNRFGVPALILFMAVGMLAGSDGLGRIVFNDAALAQLIGVIALIYILFSGGLDTDWTNIRPVLLEGLVLANVGVLVSTIIAAVGAWLILGFDWPLALLLGAIISSTDAAAVFSVMRTRGIHLKHQLEPLIELESGSNDPIAVFLTIGITQLLINPQASIFDLVPAFIFQMLLGVAGGYAFGRLMIWVINRIRLQQEGLYVVLTMALTLLTYGFTALIGGNGFLAVYLAGIMLGNANIVHKRSILRFHDGIAWLSQIAMFLVLGLLIFPSQLPAVAGQGLAMALWLVFVARPLSVIISLGWTRRSLAQLLMISWAGLRGAVPIVLATFPLLAGIPDAPLLFNLVFFIVLVSVLVQGVSISWVARWLGVMSDRPESTDSHLFVPEVSGASQILEAHIPPDSTLVGKSLIDADLPRGLLIVQIQREGGYIIPNGSTVFAPGDRLVLLVAPAALPAITDLCASCSLKPIGPIQIGAQGQVQARETNVSAD